MRQSISNQLVIEKQSHAFQTGNTIAELVRVSVFHYEMQGSEQLIHVLEKKNPGQSRQGQRPTYEAGLPACWGAVGRGVAGLRVGGKVKRVTCKIPLMYCRQ